MKEIHIETLEVLEEEERQTAYGVGKALDIGNTAARKRLEPLIEEGLVEVEEVMAGDEVHKRYFKLTEEGAKRVERARAELVDGKLRDAKARFGSWGEVEERIEELRRETE